MNPQGPDVYAVPLTSRLGTPVHVRDLDDPRVRENLGALEEQGIREVRVSSDTTLEMAVAVTPGAPGAEQPDVTYEAVVVCNDTDEGTTPSEWAQEFRAAAKLPSTPVLVVSGDACSNFSSGTDVARGLIASGQAVSVLLVTVDRIVSGTRHPPISMTVFSDGAASCLITREPGPEASFQLLGSATERWLPRKEWSGLADARVTLTAMRTATRRVAGHAEEGFRYLVTPNFGSATRTMLSMAAAMPRTEPYPGLISTVGHCFSSDVPINLADLAESGRIDDGDAVLACASSRGSLAAMALRFRGPSGR